MESKTSHTKHEIIAQPGGVVYDVGSLCAHFLRLKDRRKRRGIRYDLATILVVLVMAKLCGQDKPYAIADWARNRMENLIEALRLKHARLPHYGTYQRILEPLLDGDEFEQIMSEYIAQRPEVGQDVVIAIDGKTLPGTINRDDPFGLTRAGIK